MGALNEMLMQYFNAGYYLFKAKPINYGADKYRLTRSCSSCINAMAFGHWCWDPSSSQLSLDDKIILGLDGEKIKQIQSWTHEHHKNTELKWGGSLPDLTTATTFKNVFYSDNTDIDIYVIYFSEIDAGLFLKDFEPGNKTDEYNFNNGNIAMRHYLMKMVPQKQDGTEEFLGYDLIGVEGDGAFHSFYCHNLTRQLEDAFSLIPNAHGLFNYIDQPDLIRSFINDPKNGLEPLPWYIAKVSRVIGVGSLE